MARPDDSLVGRTIAGKFLIEAHLGSGAMGQVYRARQVALEKTVAVKVLHPSLAHDEMFAARFQREAMAASRLDHPNSMRVLDFGTDPDGLLYIAMEYLDGRDLLRVIIDDGPLPESRSVDILTQALAALVVAHDMGVVHRDLKPENIMILDSTDDEGNRVDVVKVCDFGIAKINGKTLAGAATGLDGPGGKTAKGPLTTQGLVVGTPEYMSPEQGMGNPLDARSDLYSVGVILFQLVVGRLPFEAETALGIVFKQVNEPPPLPSVLQPNVHRVLETICLKALAKRPEDRYQSAREMRAALRSFFGSEISRNPSVPISVPRSGSRALENAETVGLAVSDVGSYRPPDVVHGQFQPIGTSSGLAVLPPLPVTQTNLWVLGAVALLMGAGLAAFGVTQMASPTKGVATAAPLVTAADSSPTATSSPVAEAAAPSASVASASTTSPATPNVHPSSGAGHVSAASTATPSTLAPPSAPAHAAATPVMTAAPATPTASAASAAPAPAVEGFSLVTSAASPSVTRASGVSAHDVRAALPSWKFTECYRDGLKQTKTPLAGHIKLTLTIGPTGAVSKVLGGGAASLFSATSTCMVQAVSDITVSNVASTGGSADVDLDCTPR